jgi:hypothetical protein
MITINPALSESLSIPPCLQMPELFAAIRAAAIANQPRESEAAILRTLLRKRRIDAIAAVSATDCDLDGPIESLDSAPLSPLPTLPSHILSAGWRRGDVRADANHAPPGVSPHCATLLRQGGDRPNLTAVEGDLVCGDGGVRPARAMQAVEPSEINAAPALAGAHASKGRYGHAEASLEVLAAIERIRREVSAARRPRVISNRSHRFHPFSNRKRFSMPVAHLVALISPVAKPTIP